MNKQSPIVAAVPLSASDPTGEAGATTLPTCCETCRGDGYVDAVHRVHGEAIDSDLVEVICHDCGGTGDGDWTPEPAKPARSSAEIHADYEDACRRIDAAFNPLGRSAAWKGNRVTPLDHLGYALLDWFDETGLPILLCLLAFAAANSIAKGIAA